MSMVNDPKFRQHVTDSLRPGDEQALLRWVTVLTALTKDNVDSKKRGFFGRWLVGTTLVSATSFAQDAATIMATIPRRPSSE